MELVGGGLLSTGATPSSYLINSVILFLPSLYKAATAKGLEIALPVIKYTRSKSNRFRTFLIPNDIKSYGNHFAKVGGVCMLEELLWRGSAGSFYNKLQEYCIV